MFAAEITILRTAFEPSASRVGRRARLGVAVDHDRVEDVRELRRGRDRADAPAVAARSPETLNAIVSARRAVRVEDRLTQRARARVVRVRDGERGGAPSGAAIASRRMQPKEIWFSRSLLCRGMYGRDRRDSMAMRSSWCVGDEGLVRSGRVREAISRSGRDAAPCSPPPISSARAAFRRRCARGRGPC